MVIGDSYVEALQVDHNETLPEIIEQLDDNLDVYAMAISAISLSQYIKYIEFAEEEFDPKEYLIVVVGNDFDESLCSYKRKQGTYCFDENFELQFIPFPGYSTIRNLARSSAFMRYVVFNLSISWRHIMSKLKIVSQITSKWSQSPKTVFKCHFGVLCGNWGLISVILTILVIFAQKN